MKIILLRGLSNSGKTTTIERLSRFLINKGHTIGVLKHTHAARFSIDEPGKDTWRFAQSGARVIVSISDSEIAIIERGKPRRGSTERIVNLLRRSGIDFLFVEGLHEYFTRRKSKKILQVLCARSKREAVRLLNDSHGQVCITGRIASTSRENEIGGVPLTNDVRRIASMIMKSP